MTGIFRSHALWPLIAVVGLAACFTLDEPVYQYLHAHYNYHTRPVPESMKTVTRVLRSAEIWGENVLVTAIAFAMWQLDSRRRSRVLCLLVAALTVTFIVEGVKRVSGRERPEVSLGKTIFHGPDRWKEGGDVQSFPSGHAASAASFSGTLAACYPPLRPAFIVLAVGCGANRIWKERHFLSDVYLGGLFGYWFAFTMMRRGFVVRLCDWLDPRLATWPTAVLADATLVATPAAVEVRRRAA